MSGDNAKDIPYMGEKERAIVAWIEQHVGGNVERCEAQPRWRGGWWVDLRQNNKLLKLYVREERKEDFPPWPIEHEAGILQILERHGVPVPHVYGICDNPHAIVMEMIPGGLDFGVCKSREERIAVLHDYAAAVARMHAIDPQELVRLGAKMPESPEEISLGCFRLCEAMYLKGKSGPDPRIEFLRRWVNRNIPTQRKKISIVAVDSGQFLIDNGKVSGLFDFEYGCLGDPMIDLAFIPGRIGTMGETDTRPFFRRYAELTGEQLDIDVLSFHRVWWGLCTPLIITPNLNEPPPHGTYFEYIGWYIGPIMGALLTLADMKGIELDTHFDVPEAKPSRWAHIFDVMAARIPAATADEPYAIQEQRKFVEFIRRIDAYRNVEDEYLQGVSQLLAKPIDDWQQADEELERFVLEAGPEHDAALIKLLYRWSLAQAVTLIDGINHFYYLHSPFPRFSEILAE